MSSAVLVSLEEISCRSSVRLDYRLNPAAFAYEYMVWPLLHRKTPLILLECIKV